MTKRIIPVLMAACSTGGTFLAAAGSTPQQPPAVTHTTLKVGDSAPDFSLRSNQGTTVKLSDFRGKKTVILAFYVLAFTGG